MKNILFAILLIFFNTSVNAQNTDTSVIQQADYITAPLDKLSIPYGVLYDRMPQISNMLMFGAAQDTISSSPIHFQQAYYEYYQSTFNKDGLLSPEQLINNVNNYHNSGQHPLGILIANYSTIDPSAVSRGWLDTSAGQLHNVADKPSPYVSHTSYIVSTLTDGEAQDTGYHEFIIDNNFIIGNSKAVITSISVDFNDGSGIQSRVLSGIEPSQYRNLPPFHAYYPSEKCYKINVILTFQDFNVNTSHFWQVLSKKGNKGVSVNNGGCDECVVIQGCDGGDSLLISGDLYQPLSDYGVIPSHAGGIAYTFYSDNNCGSHHITNPVVFIDGIDAANTRHASQIYTKYINHDITFPLPIGQVKLANYLRQIGYDIIILDYNDGGTFMENNAMVVSKLLQTLWQNNSSTIQSDFVIIGPSMGAPVARFALSYMEHNNIPTHTRTYISFDGPQQGANVPIGVQHLVEYALQSNALNGLTSGKLSQLKHDIIENPASRQLLVNHVFANSFSPQADFYRTIFLNHLSQVGSYPQNMRKVAVVNGNITGTLNPYMNPCDHIARLQNYLNAPPIPIPNFFGFPFFTPPVSLNIDWTVFAGAENNSCNNGKFYTLSNVATYGVLPQGWTNYSSSAYNGNRSYDRSPGSYFGLSVEAGSEKLKSYLGWLPFSNFDLDNLDKFTFIPTTSSVDYAQPNPDIYTDFSTTVLEKCAGTTPFDRVYGEPFSTNHVAVDAFIAKAFLDEIQGSPVQQTVTLPISASSTAICNGSNVTLSVTGLPAGVVVTWNIPPTLSVVSSTNQSIVVTKLVSAANGNATINFTANTNCGNFLGQTTLPIGLPNGIQIVMIKEGVDDCNYVAKVVPYDPSFAYQWSDNGINYTAGFETYGYYLPPFQNKHVYVKATNICGVSSFSNMFTKPANTTNCLNRGINVINSVGEQEISISPNPSSKGWTLNGTIGKNIQSIYLSDLSGKIIYKLSSQDISGGPITILPVDLPNGMYFLKVSLATGVKTYKLLKN